MPDEQRSTPLARSEQFAVRLGVSLPILLAPMAGVCAPSLSIAVANAGGLGACGALLMSPGEIEAWAAEFRAGNKGDFQINLWVPDPPPARDDAYEAAIREFLGTWGPAVPPEAGNQTPPSFKAQCEAILAVRPKAASSIMGLFPERFVADLKARGILWFATATTIDEAKAAEQAGADAIVAQGMEAGGHRGTFDAHDAEAKLVGLMALVPQVVDAVRVPVIATGGIADGRGVAAALVLGASAVMIGTGLLRTPEARIHPAWADRIARTEAHDTMLTRAFSGRPGRSIATSYVRAAVAGPSPAPYPVQRGLTAAMRQTAMKEGDPERMQAWAGQSARLARAEPAGKIVAELWRGATEILQGAKGQAVRNSI